VTIGGEPLLRVLGPFETTGAIDHQIRITVLAGGSRITQDGNSPNDVASETSYGSGGDSGAMKRSREPPVNQLFEPSGAPNANLWRWLGTGESGSPPLGRNAFAF
jgi:hypothetical protein